MDTGQIPSAVINAPQDLLRGTMDTKAADQLPALPNGNSKKELAPHNSRGRGRAGSGGQRGGRNKRADMGRAEWSRAQTDKRGRNAETQQTIKRRKLDGEDIKIPIYGQQFSKEEIKSEGRKPKKKVAIMVGYSGSGYKGMQLNHNEKTIEGDLFSAFVAAGAISKANADDPKKSSLVRCARTDKGVHAAGNLISMKLIVEDPDIVQKINDNLSPQIRVWGMERTNGSFSAYQFCDSRIYEYLIPSHAFLPPHPDSFLGKKLVELAEEAGDIEGYRDRQKEVSTFWEEAEERYIKPILDEMDPAIRPLVLKALYEQEAANAEQETTSNTEEDSKHPIQTIDSNNPPNDGSTDQSEKAKQSPPNQDKTNSDPNPQTSITSPSSDPQPFKEQTTPLGLAIKDLKAAYIRAKRSYRISVTRLSRIQSTLTRFHGSQNFHNYTVQKSPRDPSSTRVIKSFNLNSTPILRNNIEWLSLKVHGQSFMMHQIRKMVSMTALIVRCGCHEGRIQDSYQATKFGIPKAPGLGLLLERPVFDTYNERLVGQYGREKLGFEKFEKEMQEFKELEIYGRIFGEEERENVFGAFFAGIDQFRSAQSLYLTSVGVEATKRVIQGVMVQGRNAGNGEEGMGGESEDEVGGEE